MDEAEDIGVDVSDEPYTKLQRKQGEYWKKAQYHATKAERLEDVWYSYAGSQISENLLQNEEARVFASELRLAAVDVERKLIHSIRTHRKFAEKYTVKWEKATGQR